MLGGIESRGGYFAATNDENTVMYTGKALNAKAEEIKKFIEEKINYSEKPFSSNITDEITKLVNLKAQGHLTEEEFINAKKKLLEN